MSLLQFSVEGLDLGLDVVDGELGFAPFVLSKDEQPFGLEGQRLKSKKYKSAENKVKFDCWQWRWRKR